MTETALRTRYKGHEVFNQIVRKDWMAAINLDPDAFDALLYLPVDPKPNDAEQHYYESDDVTDLDSNQDTLTYADPFIVPVLDCPDETEAFFTMNDGDTNLGEGELPLVLRVGYESVPVGAVLEWVEETATGNRRVWWYVHSQTAYGSNNIGTLSICIPCRNFNDSVSPQPKDKETDNENNA